MTGLQRNADVVRLASYAPLLANESHVQWNPDAIWFDNDESWETPNWEVQKLFGTNVGDEVVPSTYDAPADAAAGHHRRRLPLDLGHRGGVRQRHGDLQRHRRDALLRPVRRRLAVDAAGRHVGGERRSLRADQHLGHRRPRGPGRRLRPRTGATTRSSSTPPRPPAPRASSWASAPPAPTTSTGGTSAAGTTPARCCSAPPAAAPREVKALEGKSLTTGQTYRVKVVVDGTHIELYLDGELQMEYDQPAPPAEASTRSSPATRGAATSSPRWSTPPPARPAPQVDVSDAGVEGTATVTTLSGAPGATNTKAAPNTIKPRTREVDGISESFAYEFPASSVTFIRMGTADAVAPVVDDLAVVGAGRQRLVRRPRHGAGHAPPTTARSRALEVSVDDGAVDHASTATTGEVTRPGRRPPHRRRSARSTPPATSARSAR